MLEASRLQLKENTMGFIAWIVVGLIAGAIAKAVMPGSADEPGGWIGTLLLGIVGAVLGGWIFSMALNIGVTGFNIPSILVALLGACIVIAVLRLVTRRSA